MSLNDDVLRELHEEGLDQDPPKVLLESSSALTQTTELPEYTKVQACAQALENLLERAHRLQTYNTLRSDLLQTRSISRAGAEHIEAVCEGLLSNGFSLATYTKSASKTNYDQTVRHVQSRISLENDAQAQGYQDFIGQSMQDLRAALSILDCAYLPLAKSAILENQALALKANQKLNGNKDVVFECVCDGEHSFVNLTTCDLKTVNLSKLLNLPSGMLPAAQQGLKALIEPSELVTQSVLISLVHDLIEHEIHDPEHPKITVAESLSKTVSLKDLVAIYMRSQGLMVYIEQMRQKAAQALKALEVIAEEASEKGTSSAMVDAFVTIKGGELIRITATCTELMAVATQIRHFNVVSRVFLETAAFKL